MNGNFRINDEVTWGSGAARAAITGFRSEARAHEVVRLAVLRLTNSVKDVTTGESYPAGTLFTMGVSALRAVN